MNNRFEFEDRTYNQPISTKHIKEILLDEKALTQGITDPVLRHKTARDTANALRIFSGAYGIPFSSFPDGRALHSYRARRSPFAALE